MVDPQTRLLTVAVTSRALFNLEEGHTLFEREGLEAYSAYQREHEDDILQPGVAFPVVRKLFALNQLAPPQAPHVDVILLSRNSADTGLRIFQSIAHYEMPSYLAMKVNGFRENRVLKRLVVMSAPGHVSLSAAAHFATFCPHFKPYSQLFPRVKIHRSVRRWSLLVLLRLMSG